MSVTLTSVPGRPVYTTAPPASRASWTGQLRVAHLTIPVKAYAAVVTPDSPLKQLHATCGERIEYRKWCPKHGIVPNEEIIKG
ncbi:MAG: Ku protein [Thermoguttaceae bacterium]